MCNVKDYGQMTILERKSHPAIKAHLDMLQGIISRMAKNSASCKSWTIPLVTALLMLAVEKNITPTGIVYIPLCLFYLLDCYYLGLERMFRDRQRDFIVKLNKGEDISEEIFFSHENDDMCWFLRRLSSFIHQVLCTLDGMFSFSTSLFYGILALLIYYLS